MQLFSDYKKALMEAYSHNYKNYIKGCVSAIQKRDERIKKLIGYKTHPCEGIYDTDWDSYCSLVSLEDFKKNYVDYIDKADKKRNSIYKYDIKKNLNMK